MFIDSNSTGKEPHRSLPQFIRDMRKTEREGTDISSQRCHFDSKDENYSSKTASSLFGKRQSVAPLPSRPKMLNSLIRRISSSTAISSTSSCSSFYAGPRPTGADGSVLKSCLKKLPSENACVRSYDHVSFGHVDVREYCRQVGDNPSVSCGCPLAIGWMFNYRGKFDIDSYEADRAADPASAKCEKLSPKHREKLLIEIGEISPTQIAQGQMQAYYDRHLRTETLLQLGGPSNARFIGTRERILIMKESAARIMNRATKGISHTQEQQKLWDDAHEAANQRSNRQSI